MGVRHGRRFTPGVATLFLLVALVPVGGLVIVSAQLVSKSAEQAQSAQAITETTSHLNDAIHVQSQVTVESFTANAVASASGLGVPLNVVAEVTGLDIQAYHAESVQAVDASMTSNDFGQARDLLLAARALVGSDEATTNEIALAYGRVEDSFANTIESDLRQLRLLSLNSGDAGELTDSLRILELSVALRGEMTEVTKAYFGARFAIGRPSDAQAELLFEEMTSYHATLDELEAIVAADSPLKAVWEAVDADPSVVAIHESVDELLDALIAGGTSHPAFGANVSMADISGNTQLFVDSLQTIAEHVAFVDAVAVVVGADADATRAGAEAAREDTTNLAITLGLAALVAGVAATWWIVRPLRRMAGAVDRLQRGELAEPVREAGPREVRSAARALNEAVDHLNLAERQAIALAGSNPDDPVLEQTAPGRLGASLQDAVASLARSMSEREEFRQRLAHESAHDGLTGLSNRAATMAHLEQSMARVLRTDHDLAVLVIDLDGFKDVNDLHGHAAGDRVLRLMSRRINSSIRLGDHLGRLGADEFVVIAEPVRDAEEALELAQRVLDEIVRPVPIGETEISRTASVGVAMAGHLDLTADEILRDADLAVYKAKSEGGAKIEFCDDELKRSLRERMDIERALRDALYSDALTLHYQLVVDARSGAAVGVEALLRWPDSPPQIDGPAAFIPVAERSDLIVEIDCWVVESVARQLLMWDASPEFRDLKVSVNLSARHLSAPSLLDDVLGPLREHGVDPSRLVLEVTETALLNDIDSASRALDELRSHGIAVAIDDFGTGYTSLSHLRHLPVDVLKIDQSFVANLQHHDDQSLVRLVVETGHLLGMAITAEGVETPAQARELTAMGANSMQGYLFGRPVPADELAAAMAYRARVGV